MQTINREHFKSSCPSIFETTRTQETTVNLLNDFKTSHSFLTTSMFGFGRQHSKAQCHFFFTGCTTKTMFQNSSCSWKIWEPLARDTQVKVSIKRLFPFKGSIQLLQLVSKFKPWTEPFMIIQMETTYQLPSKWQIVSKCLCPAASWGKHWQTCWSLEGRVAVEPKESNIIEGKHVLRHNER